MVSVERREDRWTARTFPKEMWLKMMKVSRDQVDLIFLWEEACGVLHTGGSN